MTTWFVTRHNGAVQWAEQEGFHVDKSVDHFDPADIQSGDTVMGTLPINLIAEVNQKGGRYLHLSLQLPPESRGKELTVAAMREYGARLEEYWAQKIENHK